MDERPDIGDDDTRSTYERLAVALMAATPVPAVPGPRRRAAEALASLGVPLAGSEALRPR